MEKKNCKTKENISYQMLRIVFKIMEIHKQVRSYGTDQPLFEAEIHMIQAIKNNKGIHVIGLADLLGITKGAVSQTLKKLEKKGMIIKETDISNLSRVLLKLSEKGEVAYQNHEKLHEEFDQEVNEVLEDASLENREFLKSFLTDLEGRLEKF